MNTNMISTCNQKFDYIPATMYGMWWLCVCMFSHTQIVETNEQMKAVVKSIIKCLNICTLYI